MKPHTIRKILKNYYANVTVTADGHIQVFGKAPNSGKDCWWLFGYTDNPETLAKLCQMAIGCSV